MTNINYKTGTKSTTMTVCEEAACKVGSRTDYHTVRLSSPFLKYINVPKWGNKQEARSDRHPDWSLVAEAWAWQLLQEQARHLGEQRPISSSSSSFPLKGEQDSEEKSAEGMTG